VKKSLKELIERNQKLKPIVFKSFKTKEELNRYSSTIEREINEYYSNLEKIEELERELMTPEEQKKEDELLRLMKKKRQGEL
jgi:hypothetical protein